MRKLNLTVAIGLLLISMQTSAQHKIIATAAGTENPAKKVASIAGILKDARTKNPLIEAVVTVSSPAFEGRKIALTDSTGMYRLKELPAGTYSITFEMEGYRTFTQENIILKEAMSLGVSFEMVKDRVKNIAKAALKKENW